MNKNEEVPKQIVAELVRSFEEALGILAAAVARSGDAEKFRSALHQQITSAASSGLAAPLTVRLATSALAAVDAVRLEGQSDDQGKRSH